MPTAFTPLPTAFGLPASNPPYPPAVGSAPTRAFHRCSDRLRFAPLGRTTCSTETTTRESMVRHSDRSLRPVCSPTRWKREGQERPRHAAQTDNAKISDRRSSAAPIPTDRQCAKGICAPQIPRVLVWLGGNALSRGANTVMTACGPLTVTRDLPEGLTATAGADTVQTRPSPWRAKCRNAGTFGNRPRDGESRNRPFARALSAILTLSERKARARNTARERARARRRRNARNAWPRWVFAGFPGKNNPGGVGVGEESSDGAIIDVFCLFRGVPRKTCCVSVTRNFGRPVSKNPAARNFRNRARRFLAAAGRKNPVSP